MGGVMDIFKENRLGKPSSPSGWGYLYFTLH